MDYTRPLETVFPSVTGRVLGVLARTDTELPILRVAELAGVQRDSASRAVRRLVDLGIVTRREMAGASLVRLERANVAATALLALVNVRESAVEQLKLAARKIDPVPASLSIYGSFARGTSTSSSDLDVIAIRAGGIGSDDPAWLDTFGEWQSEARRIVGNPVHSLDISIGELPRLVRTRPLWRTIVKEALTLVGADPERLAAAPAARAKIVSQAAERSSSIARQMSSRKPSVRVAKPIVASAARSPRSTPVSETSRRQHRV